MIEWYKKVVFENYANFNGRARRSEYWYFILANIIVNILLSILDNILNLKFGNSGVLSSVYSLLVFIPGIAVSVRRLHDIGKSGWWVLIFYMIFTVITVFLIISVFSQLNNGTAFGFTSMLAIFVFLMLIVGVWFIVWLATNGDQGTNIYGPDPKGSLDEELNQIGQE